MKSRNLFSRRLALAGAAATVFMSVIGVQAQAGNLVLYTASNDAIEKSVLDAFKASHPDINVSTTNMSTGPITEKAIAEMSNPQADVVWMVNNFALKQLKDSGALQPYSPPDSIVDKAFMDPDGFWIGHNGTVMALAVNTKLIKEKGLPMPKGWVDLIKPVYKGQITVAAPTKSGTGFTIISTMQDAFGANFVDNLHQNIFQYNSSGSAAARQVGGGETVIGLSYDTAIMQQVKVNSNVEMVLGSLSPNVIEGAGLLSGAPHEAEGKIFLNWLFSKAGLSVLDPHIGLGAAKGFGKINQDEVSLWKLRRPVNAENFKRTWAKKYEK